MRIALVYDYINQYGGGERVLDIIASTFPKADIYTLFYDKSREALSRFKAPNFENRIIGTSFLDKSYVIRNHHPFIPLMAKAAGRINLGDKYDVILSIGAGYAKGIQYQNSYHLSYIFTPLRYAWDVDHYLKNRFNNLVSQPAMWAFKPVASYLRQWDYIAGQAPSKILTLSSYIARNIQKFYNREAELLFPPVDTEIFKPKETDQKGTYYMAAGRLMHYKNFDTIVLAFNRIKEPLKIVGRGRELDKLKKMNTSSKTEFISDFLSDEDMRRLYAEAKAFIFPQIEDFGLVAAEALACGTPVIAYTRGGSEDMIVPGINGIFIEEQTPEAIENGVKNVAKMNNSPLDISLTAKKFSKKNFIDKIKKEIDIRKIELA